MTTIARPAADEFDAYFAGYVARSSPDVLAQLERQAAALESLLALPDAESAAPMGPGEWSLRELLVHLCDFERVFAYRALRFSRGDAAPIEAFEQDPYVAASEANTRPLRDLVEEFRCLRRATVLLFAAMTPTMLERRGVAGGAPVSVRALAHITAGHCAGHFDDIARAFPRFAPG